MVKPYIVYELKHRRAWGWWTIDFGVDKEELKKTAIEKGFKKTMYRITALKPNDVTSTLLEHWYLTHP